MAAAIEAPLIVILGPTASGKTALAIRLARKFNGEIICADSRTVYGGLDIGTAKPTAQEQSLVPHHMLDVVKPNEPFSVARFQKDAQALISEIRARGNVPFLVGGSGLYIDSVLFAYELSSPPDPARRQQLEGMDIAELFHYCSQHNIELPNNSYNKRYVIRAIEQGGINNKRRSTPINNTFIVGITTEKLVLKQRIRERARSMFISGVLDEASAQSGQFGWSAAPLRAPVYQICRQLLRHEVTSDQAVDMLSRSDWQLVRKQMTWFKRNRFINWYDLAGAYDAVHHKLAQ